MVSNWRRKHTMYLLMLAGVFIVFGTLIGPVGPKYMFDRAVDKPKAEDAGVWMLRAANLYKYTMRKAQADDAYMKYLELFNEEMHDEKKHYYNQDEYIWTRYNQLDNMEGLPRAGYQKRRMYMRYEDAMYEAEDMNENHPAIKKFKSKMISWR